jgi:hypothetical protein
MNHKTSTLVPVVKKGKVNGLKRLIREVESDDEDDSVTVPVTHSDTSKPWMTEFTRYLEMLEAALASETPLIQWWGVSRLIIVSNDTFLTIFTRSMPRDTLYGHPLRVTTYP